MNSTKTSETEAFAAQIIEDLQKGTAPWVRPWKAGEFVPPFNPLSGTIYKGQNFVRLARNGFADPRWMTLRQANEKEWHVRKGEKSSKVVYWQYTKQEPVLDDTGKPVFDANGKPEVANVLLARPFMSISSVFHASQMEGDIPIWKAQPLAWNPVERAEKLLQASGAVLHHDQLDRAFYRSSSDAIHLPPKEQFLDADKYYATTLHELCHWTGAAHRMNRDFGSVKGSEDYAKEELRAEIGSWMLCMELGLPFQPEQHLSYVGSWIKALQDDPFEIVRACRDAEQIKQHILGFEQEKVMEQPAIAKADAILAPEQRLASEKTYLAVPYAEKDRAKALGARWDRQEKAWFAPEGADLSVFSAWLGHPPAKELLPLSPQAEFAQRLAEAGLDLAGELPLMDGQLHRVAVHGASEKRDGVYKGFLDGHPAGWFQNHKTGETGNWKSCGHVLSQEQIAALKTETAQKQEQSQKIRESGYAQAARRAYAIWKNTPAWANEGQLYLARKQVPAIGVKVDENGNLMIAGRDTEGRIQTLQTITPDAKRFERGTRKAGAFHVIDPLREFGTGAILIAEGYATAASVHLATGQPVVCAFDAGNLLTVATALRTKYPEVRIAFMADNDANNSANPGLNKAFLAADAVGGHVYAPVFTSEETQKGLTDWNDLHVAHGIQALREQIDFSKPLEKSLTKAAPAKQKEPENLELTM